MRTKKTYSLTPAGEILEKSLRQIYLIDKSTNKNIEEISKGHIGKITIGINPTRSRILIPKIMKRYVVDFPQVEISLVHGDTVENLSLLERGKLDIVLGVSTQIVNASQFKIKSLSQDRIFFLATKKFINHYDTNFFERLSSDSQVSLHTLTNFPFCRNLAGSTITDLINYYLYKEQISLNTRYNISDYDTQIELCINHLAAFFCPSMISSRVLEYEQNNPNKDSFMIFSIKEIKEKVHIDVIQNKFAFQPYYIKRFIQEIKNEVNKIQKLLP